MNSANQHTGDIAAAEAGERGAAAGTAGIDRQGSPEGGGKYSPFQLARKYIRYYLTAANGKGHGIHSPFVFDLVINVLNDSRVFPEYAAIEGLRRKLEADPTILSIEDMGAGSASGPAVGVIQPGGTTMQRSISDIARRMAKPRKLGQLLFRIARYYQPERVLELGTSLGLSTAYLAAGATGEAGSQLVKTTEDQRTAEARVQPEGKGEEKTTSVDLEAGRKRGGITEIRSTQCGAGKNGGGRARVFTIEGAPEVAAVAESNFRALGLENIECTIGNFDQVLKETLDRAGRIDLAFIDGNHRLEPTLRYFDALYGQLSSSAVVIFDDIHWSREMEEAWESIKKDPRVYLSVDLFFIGLVFFRDSFKVKQDFVIRF